MILNDKKIWNAKLLKNEFLNSLTPKKKIK